MRDVERSCLRSKVVGALQGFVCILVRACLFAPWIRQHLQNRKKRLNAYSKHIIKGWEGEKDVFNLWLIILSNRAFHMGLATVTGVWVFEMQLALLRNWILNYISCWLKVKKSLRAGSSHTGLLSSGASTLIRTFKKQWEVLMQTCLSITELFKMVVAINQHKVSLANTAAYFLTAGRDRKGD